MYGPRYTCMAGLLWIFLPVFIAAGSALLAFYVMQARLEVAVAREREAAAELRAAMNSHNQIMEEKIRAAEEVARRNAFDAFLADFRVEERHYMRETKSLLSNKRSMILQERLYFRNIPLSNWVEHELTVEQGGDLAKLAKACSVFTTHTLGDSPSESAKLLKSA